MPLFNYTAKKPGGELVSGTLTADSRRGALDAISRLGHFPLEIQEKDIARGSALMTAPTMPTWASKKVRADEVTVFTRQLADMIRAGVPINRALATLGKQAGKASMTDVIEQLRKDVSAGQSLHDALGAHPQAFDSLYVSVVRAGETGGFLDDSLRRIAVFRERDADLLSRVKTALAYPTLLLIVGVGAVAFLLTFFIPKFATIFESFKADLPATTQVVVAMGTFMRHWWWLVLGGLIFAIAALSAFLKTPAGRLAIDRLKTRLPVFGRITRYRMVSRFCHTLGALLKSGVPIVEGLKISKDALGNVADAPRLDEVVSGVRQGKSLATLLSGTGLFPEMACDMIAVGEETATLDEVLVTIAESADGEVDRRMRIFVALFEPAMLFVMAAIVGFIVISMLLPVFTISGAVK